jgi:hypothetical protein
MIEKINHKLIDYLTDLVILYIILEFIIKRINKKDFENNKNEIAEQIYCTVIYED